MHFRHVSRYTPFFQSFSSRLRFYQQEKKCTFHLGSSYSSYLKSLSRRDFARNEARPVTLYVSDYHARISLCPPHLYASSVFRPEHTLIILSSVTFSLFRFLFSRISSTSFSERSILTDSIQSFASLTIDRGKGKKKGHDYNAAVENPISLRYQVTCLSPIYAWDPTSRNTHL